VFGAVDAVLFRPLPFADADRLVAVEVVPGASVSKSTLSALRARSRAFEGLAGWSRCGFTWTGAGPARVLTGARMTADLVTILGATPAVGRLLQPGDDAPGAAPVAVASNRFWRSELGADVAAVGRTLQLDGVAHTLVGVTESEFAFPDAGAELYLPATLDPADESDWTAGYLLVLGRLRPGPGSDAARNDVRAAQHSPTPSARCARLETSDARVSRENRGIGSGDAPRGLSHWLRGTRARVETPVRGRARGLNHWPRGRRLAHSDATRVHCGSMHYV
jgi:hypothetical protein